MEYATEEEMTEYCEKYSCIVCVIAYKCSLFKALFGYLPEQNNKQINFQASITSC